MRGRLIWIFTIIAFFAIGLASEEVLADQRYRVRSGDSLAKISKKFKVSVDDIKAVNRLQGNSLKPKQVLVIPGKGGKPAAKGAKRHLAQSSSDRQRPAAKAGVDTETHVVKRGETALSIARSNGITLAEFKRLNGLGKKARLRTGREVLVPRKARQEEEQQPDPSDEIPEKVSAEISDKALGTWRDEDERSLFIKVVKSFLGIPYKLGGNSIRGIDCSAFVKKVYEIFDVTLPRTAREQSLVGRKVDRSDLQVGDIVFFRTRRDHVGIYVGNNEFIHMSYRSRQAKVDNMDSDYFSNRFLRGVRVKELAGSSINQAKNEF